MELDQNQHEFTSFGIKVILIVVAAAVIVTAIFFGVNSLNNQNSVIRLENLPFYDSTNRAVVLSNNTASLSGYQNCDIYVSGPNKQLKYFQTVSCDSLSSTEISRQELLSMFDNQTGTYTIIIYSETKSQGSILQFSIM